MHEKAVLEETKERFKEEAAKDQLCPAFKVFEMGSHGTAMVGCGLPANHRDWGLIARSFDHVTRREDGDASVTFRWTT